MADEFLLDPARIATLKPRKQEPASPPVDVRANLMASSDIPSDKAAAALRVQEKHDIPATVAMENPGLAPKAPLLDLSTIESSATLRRHASTMIGAAAIRDEPQLSLLQRAMAEASRQFKRDFVDPLSDVGTAIKSGFPLSDAQLYGALASPFGIAGQAVQPLVGTVLPENMFARAEAELLARSRAMSDLAAAQLDPVLEGQKGMARDALLVWQGLPARASSMVLTAVTKSPTAGMTAAGVTTGGGAYAEGREAGLPALDSTVYAAGAGVSEAFTEMLPAVKLVADLVPGKALHRMVLNQLAADIPGEQVNAVVHDFNSWAYLNPDKTLSEFIAERPDAARQALVASIITSVAQTSAIGLSANLVDLNQQRITAKGEAAMVEQMKRQAQIIAASKIAGANPEMMADIAQGMAEESGSPARFYVDGADLVDALNQSGVSIQEFMDMVPSARDDINEGFVAQTTIALPVGEVLTNVMQSKIGDALSQKLRVSETGMSPEIASQFLQSSYNEQITMEAERILADVETSETFKAGTDAVRARVESELIAAGTTPKDAKQYAELQAQFFTVMAHDWGGAETALSLFERQYGQQPMVGRVDDGREALNQSGAFDGVTREQFLGSPRITSNKNADQLRPKELTTVKESEPVEFSAGSRLVARYSEDGAAVYDGANVIASYNFGDTLVVDKKYRRKGIGEELVYQWRKRNPQAKTAESRTKASQSLQEKVWARIESERGFNQQSDSARGSYTPTTGQLRLFAKADTSTFLHETGHQFLDLTVKFSLTEDAPAAVKERADAVLAWLGVESSPDVSRADAWLQMSLEEQRPMHEKFAETFEQYLFSGKAPSLELAKAFRAFKDFLKAVYGSIKAFVKSHPDASLDPEVTALMDRMLATDLQIAEAGAARSVIPLFSVKPELMTPEGWRKYQEDFTGVKREAAEYIDLRRLRDMRYMRVKGGKVLKDLQKETAEKRRQVRIDAARNILTQPVYKVRQLLEAKAEKPARKVKYEGLNTSVDSMTTAIAHMGGMNRDAAVAEWGVDQADFQQHPFGQPILRAKGGMMPGDVVEALAEYGYLPLDEHGKPDMNKFADLLDWESRGTPHYSIEADWSQIMASDFLPIPDIENNIFAGARLDRYAVDRLFVSDPVSEALPSISHMMANYGVNPDELALMFGYPGGREMIVDILSNRPTNEAIEAETDRLMIERYGDIESPEAMARIVDEAVSLESRSRILVTEYAAMTGMLGNVTDLMRAAKQSAADIVDVLKVGSLRPEKYRLAAARAGKDAITSWNKGKQDAAITAKRGQVLNEALAKESATQKADVKSKVKEVRKWFKKDADVAKTRNMDMVALARSIAADYGMATDAQSGRASEAMGRIKQYDPQAAADLDSITVGLPEKKPYTELTVAEFRAVTTVAEAVWNLSRYDKKVELGGVVHEIDSLAERIVAHFGGIGKPITHYRTLTRADNAGRHMLGMKAHLRKPESFLEGADIDILLFNPLSNAIADQKIARGKLVEQYVKLLEKIRPELYTGQIVGKGLYPDGSDFIFSGGMIEVLHAILHTGNDSNKRKLLLGRKWADKTDDGGIDTSRWDAFVAELVKQGKLKKEHYDFAQGVWDLMESIKPQAQQAHKKMFGYYFNEVTANPIATPFGVYAGGYIPAIGDRADADTAKKMDATEMSHAATSSNWPTTGKGFTQARVEYNVALELNLGALVNHLDATTRFIHIEPVIKEMAKVFNRSDVKAAVEGYAPGAMANIINPWLIRSAQQTIGTPGHKEIDTVFRYLNTVSGMSMMAANVTNAVQQTTGFTLALASKDVTGPAMLRALVNVTKQPGSAANRAKLLSKWMSVRISQQSFEMEGRLNALLLGDSVLDTVEKTRQFVQNNAYFMQTMVQNRLDVIVWTAAYDVALARNADDPVAVADRAVRDTQGSFAPEDISNIEAGNQVWRSIIKFYSYFGTVSNLMITQSMMAMRERSGFGANARLAYIWFVVFGTTSMLAKAFVTGWPDDEEDEDGQGVISAWLGNWLGGGAKWVDFYLTANAEVLVAMAPGVGAGAQAVVAVTDDNPVNDRLNTSPMLSYLGRSAQGLGQLLFGEMTDEDVKSKEVKNLLAMIGLTGIPTGQIGKSVGYAIDVEQGKKEPESTVDYALGMVRGR